MLGGAGRKNSIWVDSGVNCNIVTKYWAHGVNSHLGQVCGCWMGVFRDYDCGGGSGEKLDRIDCEWLQG